YKPRIFGRISEVKVGRSAFIRICLSSKKEGDIILKSRFEASRGLLRDGPRNFE
ncbi:unnamed protein product, partial [Larinioides sclopetarius]